MSEPREYHDWICDMEMALAEQRKVRAGNAARRAAHQREETKAMLAWPMGGRAWKPWPRPEAAKIGAAARAIIARETAARSAMRQQPPEVWAARVRQLTGAVRQRVGCIVWWDFFGDRPAKDPWNHLDKYIEAEFAPAPREAVALGPVGRGLHAFPSPPAGRRGVPGGGAMLEGEEWKHKAEPRPSMPRRTRAEEQARVDTEYCNGRMTLDDWRARSDELSDPSQWCARGRQPA